MTDDPQNEERFDEDFLEELQEILNSDAQENTVSDDLSFFKDKTVFITGNTGFKGSWLTVWLLDLGAKVIGYSMEPPTDPSLFALAGLKEKIIHIDGNIGDQKLLRSEMAKYAPDIVFHLAAQPLVIDSYHEPMATFDTNAAGTVYVLEAIRHCPSVQAAIFVTSDKCYENQDWVWGYREQDRLGGNDPYSASKAMAELGIQCYAKSFFNQEGTPSIASVRAGNVIGGGDFSSNRLIPDCVKALQTNTPIKIRNPSSVRSWIYILDVLYGYLVLTQRLCTQGKQYAGPWNFGPGNEEIASVSDVADVIIDLWGGGDWIAANDEDMPHEAELLRLNSDKAVALLGWAPNYSLTAGLEETISWYQECLDQEDMYEVCLEQIDRYQAVISAELLME